MQKQPSFPNADAYVASLDGWRRECVDRLRASVLTQEKLQETLKWGHLVYEANGPVLLIRAEPERVLFGFWRGRRLRGIEPALRESGQYEMATIEIREGMPVDAATARALAAAAVALNEELGDPRLAAKRRARPAAKRVKAAAKRNGNNAPRKESTQRLRAKTSRAAKASSVGSKTSRATSAGKRTARRAQKEATSSRSRKAGRRGG